MLAFLVDTDGSVRQLTVLQGSGFAPFDDAAVRLWQTARFSSPATLDGRPFQTMSYAKVQF
jgi:TonB family protein